MAKNKTYSAINIIGLAVAMTFIHFFVLLIYDELSYDRFHKNANNIYRIVKGEEENDTPKKATVPPSLAAALKKNFPEVLETVRMEKYHDLVVQNKNFIYRENKIFRADPSFFKIFSFRLAQGNPEIALADPNTAVISQVIAHKFFGQEDPYNKILSIGGSRYRITGILENVRHKSHFDMDILLTLVGDKRWLGDAGEQNTYFLLPDNYPVENITSRLPYFVEKYRGHSTSYIGFYRYYIQPLTSIHLNSHLLNELGINSYKSDLILLGTIAGLILVISGLNFINLSTARSSLRSNEIGIRKTVGAQRKQLMVQFLTESVILAIFSFLVAIILVQSFFTRFSVLAGKDLLLSYKTNIFSIAALLGLAIVFGLLAGVYPAFFLSGMDPLSAFKQFVTTKRRRISFRRLFVIVQFAISTALMLAAGVTLSQYDYMKNTHPGFDKERILVVSGLLSPSAFKEQLLTYPHVSGVSITNTAPGGTPHPGHWSPNLNVQDNMQEIHEIIADYDFTHLLDIQLVEGRNFDPDNPSDLNNAFLLNETATRQFELANPVGHFLQSTELSYRSLGQPQKHQFSGHIIGIVKDFHLQSMHHPIGPVVIHLGSEANSSYPMKGGEAMIKIIPGYEADVLRYAEKVFKKSVPNIPFEYHFVDDLYDAQYRKESRQAFIFTLFTAAGLLISCLGLFGMASFATQRKTKEIGIRKVFGASMESLLFFLSQEFIALVVLSNIIAAPVAYYFLSRWLQNYPYRISMSWWIFGLAGLIVMIVALLTVSFQVIRTATANPVQALRYE